MVLRLFLVAIEHEKPNGRRQVAVPALRTDHCNNCGQEHIAAPRDFLEPIPERIFETDARLVAINDDRAFDDCRVHRASPPIVNRQRACRQKPNAAQALKILLVHETVHLVPVRGNEISRDRTRRS